MWETLIAPSSLDRKVSFVFNSCKNCRIQIAVLFLVFISFSCRLTGSDVFKPGKRIVFLGDSVTAAGQYVTYLELQLRVEYGERAPELINLGLPSEGVTGLSEEPHPFPRPNVHERLERALDILEPDVIVACYGINDGIYSPFDSTRFEQFKDGIKKLIQEVKLKEIELVLCTPIAFDAQPFRKAGKLLPHDTEKPFAWFSIFDGYEDVIGKYSEYVKTLSDDVDVLVDVHDPIRYSLLASRKTNKAYAMSGDGVHVDSSGHLIIARAIASACGVKWYGNAPMLFAKLDARTKVLHDSYLSHVGHKRPGIGEGLTVERATKKAAEILKDAESMLLEAGRKLKTPRKGAMAAIDSEPELPDVLIIGDSISIGYTLGVRANLKGKANVHRPPTNCGPTVKGMAQIDHWLGTTQWDVIHFNFGLHDLKWLGPEGQNLAEPNGKGNSQQVPIGEYAEYLDALATKLKATGAKVIFRNTTPVPEGAKGRVVGDSKRYNEAAAKVMKKHGIAIDDMYGYTIDKLDRIMLPANVHFNQEGNAYLAQKVSAVIQAALEATE